MLMMFERGLVIIAGLALLDLALGFLSRHPTVSSLTKMRYARPSLRMGAAHSGKIIVTGIGKVDEDEFMLNLLNEQGVWESVVLATDDSVSTQKRFLSRTARYSGLLNILDFATTDINDGDQLKSLLDGADAWLAFNVTQSAIPTYSSTAVDAGIQRAVFTMELPPERINETTIPEFDTALNAFQTAGGAFTGIRHGTIIPGDEDNAYEIVNATIPCLEDTVERGVLARVAAELLGIDSASNEICGLSSSSAFAGAYLNILRSSGLTRQQEVQKVFSGGVQRVAQLTVNEYEAEKKRKEEKAAKEEQRKLDEKMQLEKDLAEARALPSGASTSETGIRKAVEDEDVNVNFDLELDDPFTEEKVLSIRAHEILEGIWQELDARMYSKSTSKNEFFESNMERARGLAEKELAVEKEEKQQQGLEKQANQLMVDKLMEVERKQYSKLLALERREMQTQQQISDTWVKYIYLLMEQTMDHCKKEGVLFHNMDEFQQSLLLRNKANELRSMCSLPPYEVVYDPLDAAEIVSRLAEMPLGLEVGLTNPIEDTMKELDSKYGATLKSVAALRGANQIVELAIETLKKELPTTPPSVNELRRAESAMLSKQVSEMKLEATRNRGQPFKDGESVVGRM
mmetsp:Transcript_27785/g.46674  ORF Transcript_27785/g.46674 Transcript_27785/m.46674 type:complete len:629 (+) Transcript_27785:86-1972(+)